MLQYPGFNPIAIELGPVKVHWYGIMYLIGFAGGWWLARLRAARPGSTWKPSDVDDLMFYAMLGVILGGRIGYVLFYGLELLGEAIRGIRFKIWEGGMSFHGGLLGVLVADGAVCLAPAAAISRDVFDFAAPLPALGLFFGRIGNFINGELWGKPTTRARGAFNVERPVVRHPSQLYEACLEGLVLFTSCGGLRRKPRPRLAPSGLFLAASTASRASSSSSCACRMSTSAISAGGWLTMGQVLSLPMIVGGIVLLAIRLRRRTPSGNFAVAQ